jgi:hypothetical protein
MHDDGLRSITTLSQNRRKFVSGALTGYFSSSFSTEVASYRRSVSFVVGDDIEFATDAILAPRVFCQL